MSETVTPWWTEADVENACRIFVDTRATDGWWGTAMDGERQERFRRALRAALSAMPHPNDALREAQAEIAALTEQVTSLNDEIAAIEADDAGALKKAWAEIARLREVLRSLLHHAIGAYAGRAVASKTLRTLEWPDDAPQHIPSVLEEARAALANGEGR